jgi:hypothetical protein
MQNMTNFTIFITKIYPVSNGVQEILQIWRYALTIKTEQIKTCDQTKRLIKLACTGSVQSQIIEH